MEFTEIESALADKPEALEFVKGLHERAGKFTPELEAEVGKLGEYRGHSEAIAKLFKETGAKDVDGLLKDFGNLKATNADLVKQRDTWRQSGKGENSPEMLALKEQMAEGQRKLDELTNKITAAEDQTRKAEAAQRDTDLKASIMTSAAKLKANDPEDIVILLKTRGLIGHKEDGKPFYYKQNDAGENVAVKSAEDVVAWFSEKRKDLFAGSGVGGTGGNHKGGKGADEPVTHKSAVQALRAKRMEA